MIHEYIDIAHWKALFPLADLSKDERDWIAGETILGPRTLALFEHVRDEAATVFAEAERVPTDAFIWAQGEGDRREVTKVGGLPYRAATRPWPTTTTGRPLTFAAQINFADSRDIYPDLPGDILLIFIEGKPFQNRRIVDFATKEYLEFTTYYFQWGHDAEKNSAIVFEWVQLGEAHLVQAKDVPNSGWRLYPYHAHIYRTWDYPSVDPLAHPEIVTYLPTVVGGAKIGGCAAWVQDEEALPGRFLCALDSFCLSSDKPYSLLNLPNPIPTPTQEEQRAPHYWRHHVEAEAREADRDLIWGDCGTFYLFIDSHGELHWTAQGH